MSRKYRKKAHVTSLPKAFPSGHAFKKKYWPRTALLKLEPDGLFLTTVQKNDDTGYRFHFSSGVSPTPDVQHIYREVDS